MMSRNNEGIIQMPENDQNTTKKEQCEKAHPRASNIELLRIVAMLMIVGYHIVCHCVNVQLTDENSMARMHNALFNHPVFFKKLWILHAIMPFGITGNAIFLLIAGYFGVEKGNKLNIAKTSKKLLLQQGFAAVILTIASTACYRLFWVHRSVYIGLMGIDWFNSMSWFVGYYFLVVLSARLFLNQFLLRLDRKQYGAFLIVVFAFTQFGWSGGLADALASGSRTLATGIFLYSFGGFIKRYQPFKKIKPWAWIFAIGLTYVLIFITDYNSVAQSIEDYIRGGSKGRFIQSMNVYPEFSIVIMILSVSVFELFRRIHIPSSRVINFIGSSTFMVYLIHDNGFFYSIWNTKDWVTLLVYHPGRFVLSLLMWTAGTFGIGFIVYLAYLGMIEVYRIRIRIAIQR